ncbi:MAG: glycosyltransferase, partial [Candidatus Omnitrophica bacterium]|nr:glycosyltransferase [Candidatus Omnitrophota bacterium]
RERIDVIHARGTFCALIGYAPKILLRKKMIFDMRGLMAEEYVDAGLWRPNSPAYKVITAAEKYFLRHAEEVVVITDKIKSLIAHDYGLKNITVIPTCTDLEKFRPNKTVNRALATMHSLGNRFAIIYIGSLGTWYMFSEMVDFYNELAKTFANSVFIVVSQSSREAA